VYENAVEDHHRTEIIGSNPVLCQPGWRSGNADVSFTGCATRTSAILTKVFFCDFSQSLKENGGIVHRLSHYNFLPELTNFMELRPS
jgi:hypothetical protein